MRSGIEQLTSDLRPSKEEDDFAYKRVSLAVCSDDRSLDLDGKGSISESQLVDMLRRHDVFLSQREIEVSRLCPMIPNVFLFSFKLLPTWMHSASCMCTTKTR